MGALPRPEVPPGPARTLVDALHDLHHRAGWPSLREMAKEIGCSHTTVSAAFSEPRLPRWGMLELLVETLGGDVARIHELWLAASANPGSPIAGPRPDGGPAARAGTGAPPDRAALADRPAEPVPRQLPLDVAAFTGRDDELTRLDEALGSAARIVALTGTAGVGKTALAVHWAHRVAGGFGGGQLYVDLRGYDPGDPVRPPTRSRRSCADSAWQRRDPHELGERAARYRTLLADRRMLVLLDNAHPVDQIRALLPGGGSSLVVVTSRATLPGLVARDGAVRIDLDRLSDAEAVGLLRTLVGARVAEQPEDASMLAVRCARLPLALRVAAELAASRPRASLAQLLAELGDEHRSLDVLTAGDDEYTAVRASSRGPTGTWGRTRRGRSGCSACTRGATWMSTRPPRCSERTSAARPAGWASSPGPA